jgi:hypothetical protein
MKINKKIQSAAEFNPTKKSHQMSIFEMCKKIKDNKITLPLYKRELSWTLSKSVDLFNYQLFGKAPISPISMNQISGNNLVPQVSFLTRETIEDEKIKSDHQSVIDGQQRLSTNFKAYINADDFKNLVLDVSKATFTIIEGSASKYQIPVGILLNEDDNELLLYLQNKNAENFNILYPVLLQVRSKIKNYNYTINIAENLNQEEQINWFEVLNNAGSRVSVLQIAFSKLKIQGVDIYIDYTYPFNEKLCNFGFDGLLSPYTTKVSCPIATLNPAYEVVVNNGMHNNNYAPIPSDTKESILSKLDSDQLKSIFKLSLDSLEKALNFIYEKDLSDDTTRIDYILYLTGYFIYNNAPSQEQEQQLVEWFKNVSFSNKSNSKRRKEFTELIRL